MRDQIIEIFAGAILIVVGLVAPRFAWGGFGASRRGDGKPMSKWLGRALFILGGLWFVYMAVKEM